MSYLYANNLDPVARFDQLSILLDDGTPMTLRLGHSYDLTPSEVARARARIQLISSDAPVDDAPVSTSTSTAGRIVTAPGEPVPSTQGLRPYTQWIERLL